jgi:very-short-patch-repair endonuclease
MTLVEQTMFDGFVAIGFKSNEAEYGGPVAKHPGWLLGLFAQVIFGRYRADFVVASILTGDDVSPPFKLIVEIDGPEHDSRAYRRKDRERDRFFALRGFYVVRFTNQDVLDDAPACANEVLWLASELQEPNLDESFSRHLEAVGAKKRLAGAIN